MTLLRMIGSTGDGDLRGDGHAVLRIFFKNRPEMTFDPILNGQGSHTTFDVTKNIGNVGVNDIEYFPN